MLARYLLKRKTNFQFCWEMIVRYLNCVQPRTTQCESVLLRFDIRLCAFCHRQYFRMHELCRRERYYARESREVILFYFRTRLKLSETSKGTFRNSNLQLEAFQCELVTALLHNYSTNKHTKRERKKERQNKLMFSYDFRAVHTHFLDVQLRFPQRKHNLSSWGTI